MNRSEESRALPARDGVAALIAAKDWASTPLGPDAGWPSSFRTVLRLMLTSRYAMWMGWGPDLSFFYNDAYATQTLGAKHPWALGRPAREVWAEIWDAIGPLIAKVLTTGEATWDEGLLLFLERSGYPEETYHTFSYSPAPGEGAEIGGLFCVVIEETERVIGERRIALLGSFASLLAKANTAEEVFAAIEACLTADARDIPFSLTYLFDDEGRARRVSTTGFDDAHPAAPLRIERDEGPWSLRTVLSGGGAPVVLELDSRHPWPTGAWKTPPSRALLIPIARQGESRPAGVFVAGMNPHRPLDEGMRSFVRLFVGQLAAGLSNAGSYAEARERAEALAEIDRAKTTFFSNVSHEFRTPLTLMLAPIEDMRASPVRDAEERERIDLLHRNALRLLKLVNTLLDFSRIEAGRVEAVYEPTDLPALTADLASNFRSALERADLALVVDCPPFDEPIFVDRGMWEKIVLNLLSNALKFTFDGSVAVRLRLTEHGAELEVQDTGTGIAEHELPRVFERFRRIEGGRARSHEGSGIGLALVHELVRMHGGDIDVTSRVGEGTTFRVRVPRGKKHLPEERIEAARTLQATALGASPYVEEALRWITPSSAVSTPRAVLVHEGAPRILVADDNADMRDYVTRLLRERWNVEAVADGREALDAIRRNPPDLVLSDVMMPGLDGFALLRAMRGDAVLRAIPVVLLSARAGEEAAAEGLEAGADDYVVKPFTARDLLVRITARLASVEAARELNAQRQNLYRHFMQAPFPVAVFRGPRHVVELANDATLQYWGKSADILGAPLVEAVPELEDQPFLGLLDGVYRRGVSHEGREEIARFSTGPGGAREETYFNYVYAPLFDSRGRVEGILLCGFDVTDQVRSRQRVEQARAEAERLASELRVTSQRLVAAQSVGGIGIFDWELARSSVYWSPELYGLLGLRPNEIEATSEAWNERILEDDRDGAQDAFQRATEARADRLEIELRLRQPSGGSRWVRVSMQILYDGGAPVRVVGAVVDVELLKEAAAAKERALKDAERTNRAKDEFLATMSHELRTPLNAMLGWAAMLKRDPDDREKLERGLTVIERNAQAQARIVSDLLDVSRIISGKLSLAMKATDLAAVISAAADVVRPAADARDVRLELDTAPDVGATLGDPDRLQQIVWNLLSNAVRFTPPKGRVTVTARRTDSVVTLRVEDTGAGIPSEHLPHIFERFRQIDSSTTRAHGGLGLGLAIVRHLVEAHGGAVSASSEGPGLGATFTITLPTRAPLAPAPERAST